MQTIDKITIEEIKIPSLVLMERAALGVTKVVKQLCEKQARCLIVAGTGNNGGDGLAVARQLQEDNYDVSILIVGNKEKGSEGFLAQLEIVYQLQIPVVTQWQNTQYEVVIDALFGIGLTRDVTGDYAAVIAKINETNALKIAVDIPSGLDGTTGEINGCCVIADHTITFGFFKYGLILHPGCEIAGTLHLETAGFIEQTAKLNAPLGQTFEQTDIKRLLPPRENRSNKGSYGKVCVIAGNKNMAGAAYFSAMAAYKTGCGLVKIVTHESNQVILQGLVPEAIISTFGNISEAVICGAEVIEWADVVVFGPGMGTNDITGSLLSILLTHCEKPLIIDADGINMLKHHKGLLQTKKCPLMITPHLKEMAGLLETTVLEVAKDLVGTALGASKEFDLICVLKDARTVVTHCDGNAYVNRSGNNGMATAGSGDVLTGVIAGLIASGTSFIDAARLGVYIHGLAGDFAQEKVGKYSLTARDIIENIHCVLGGKTNE